MITMVLGDVALPLFEKNEQNISIQKKKGYICGEMRKILVQKKEVLENC